MIDLFNIDFSELGYGEELGLVGIKNTSDLIKPAIVSLLKTGIQEHIRACNLGKEACDKLIKAFGDKGFDVVLDQDVYPDISCLPTSFTTPESEGDVDDNWCIKIDEEHRRALNYASWIPARLATERTATG